MALRKSDKPTLSWITCVQSDIQSLKVVQAQHSEILQSNNQLIKFIKERQDTVLNRLDKVSANGSPGLEASLKDIYNKLAEVHTQIFKIQAEESARWYNMSISQLMKKSWMKPIWIVLAILILNSIGHQYGIGLDLQSILKAFTEK